MQSTDERDFLQKQLGAALGRIPSGLFVITFSQPDQFETGMLASWVQQCSFDPPHVCFSVRRDRELNQWLVEKSHVTVNILDDSQTDMIVHFGRGFSVKDPAFNGLEITRKPGSGPILAEALGFLECEIVGRLPVAEHFLYYAQVVGGKLLGDGHPMVHIRKSGFHY